MGLVALWLVACGGEKDSGGEAEAFAEGFLWGASTAGFQVEAGCPTIPAADCEDQASDWYQWVTDPDLIADPGTYLSGQPLSDGPGHYELYEADLARARDLGLGGLRVSIEWSRLFPDGIAEGAETAEALAAYADPQAMSYYNAYFDAITAAGLTPIVTLNHYTLPLWIHDGKACHEDPAGCEDRGWLDPDRLIRNIALYSAFCAQAFGDRVDTWATLNEPLAVVLAGYLLPSADRTNPPGITSPADAIAVLYRQAEAHIAMYDAVKAHDTADADGDGEASRVGVVHNLVALKPLDPASDLDAEGVVNADYVYNRAFLNAAARAEFDHDLDGVAEDVRPELAGRMDYVGINYYTRITVRGLLVPLIGDYEKFNFYPEVLFEDYPDGLYEVVKVGADYGLPIYITESGKADPDDQAGETWLRPHLAALLRAHTELAGTAAEVRGFFYWSLIDNYEWNHGMGMRFGLYEVDTASKSRTLRPLGETYRSIISSGRP